MPTINDMCLAPKKRGRGAQYNLKPVDSIPTKFIKDSDTGLYSYAEMPGLEFESVKDEIKFDPESICSEVQIKLEPESKENDSGANFSVNPWDVSNVSVFLSYCCPECDFKSGELLAFSKHAVINHVLSGPLFIDRNPLKDCNIENDENTNLNSYEAKLKLQDCADDPLFDVKPESYEMNTDPFLEDEETTVLETNVEINSKKNKSRKPKKPNVNSNEAKLEESTNDPLLNIKSEIFESDINTLIVETNIESNSNDIKNLDSQSDKNEKNGKKLHYTGSFVCGSCEFIAYTLGSLKYHIQTVHCSDQSEPQTCTDCGKVLSSKRHLKSHIERVHGNNKSNVCHTGYLMAK